MEVDAASSLKKPMTRSIFPLNPRGFTVDDSVVARRTRFILRTLSVLLLAMLAGCDRSSSDTPGNTATEDRDQEKAGLVVEVTPITPLLPRLRTHVAVDSHGNIYWIQESDPLPDGGDLVFVMGSSGVPQTIPALETPRLLAALFPNEAHHGRGAIRSMAVGPNDDLYVLFTGGTDREPICALARYSPTTAKVNIVADTHRLMIDSNMGPSIDLARGSLVANQNELWLWLRHTDAAAILQIVPTEGGKSVALRPVKIKPPPRAVVGQLTSELEDLAAGPGQSLYYVDRPRAMLWKIDSFGEFNSLQSLDGFSRELTAPAVDDSGRMCFVAGHGEAMAAKDSTPFGTLTPEGKASLAWLQMPYPAVMQVQVDANGKSTIFSITRDHFLAPPTLPLQDLQPRNLLFDPTTGTLITFDAASGELLRLKVRAK